MVILEPSMAGLPGCFLTRHMAFHLFPKLAVASLNVTGVLVSRVVEDLLQVGQTLTHRCVVCRLCLLVLLQVIRMLAVAKRILIRVPLPRCLLTRDEVLDRAMVLRPRQLL